MNRPSRIKTRKDLDLWLRRLIVTYSSMYALEQGYLKRLVRKLRLQHFYLCEALRNKGGMKWKLFTGPHLGVL